MDFNKLVNHVNFENNSTLSNQSIGSYIFSGYNYFTSGNYNGLQVGDDVDKWQIIDTDEGLKWRQNDSGGSNSSWGAWKTIVDSSNYEDYLNTNLEEILISGRIYRPIINPSTSTTYSIYPNKQYILNDISNNTTINLMSPESFPSGGNKSLIYYSDLYMRNVYLIKFKITTNVTITFNQNIIWNNPPHFLYNGYYESSDTFDICISYDIDSNKYYGIYVAFNSKNAIVNYTYSFDINEYGIVDLGLPSGTLWTDTDFHLNRSDGVELDWFYYGELKEDFENNTRGNQYGYNVSISSSDDIAYVESEGYFNTPTKTQMEELLNYCTIQWQLIDGSPKLKFTGPNGNYIYLNYNGYGGGSMNRVREMLLYRCIGGSVSGKYNICVVNSDSGDGGVSYRYTNNQILNASVLPITGDYSEFCINIRAVVSGSPVSKSVNLQNQWTSSTSYGSLSSSSYDFYESYSNYNVHSSIAEMQITISGYSSFTFYIRSYAESTYDYVIVLPLDSSTSVTGSNWRSVSNYANTSGNQSSTTWTTVTFSNIPSGSHVIRIIYGKDGSQNTNNDRGYVAIPK